MIAYADRFASIIRAASAQPALYMVWPSTQRQFDFAAVSGSYRAAADATKGVLLPAGDAWHNTLRQHRDIALYSSEGPHPTLPARTWRHW